MMIPVIMIPVMMITVMDVCGVCASSKEEYV